jgi:hypothetical protein
MDQIIEVSFLLIAIVMCSPTCLKPHIVCTGLMLTVDCPCCCSQQVTTVLDRQGVLSRLKVRFYMLFIHGYTWVASETLARSPCFCAVQAELRANVFLAINDQDVRQGGIGEVDSHS